MGKPGNQVPVSTKYEKNINYLLEELQVEKNFDVIHRKLEYANRKFGLFFIDGFMNADVMLHVMRNLEEVSPLQISKNTIEKLVKSFMPYVEVDTSEDLEEVINQILAGQAALVVEDCKEVILVDTREYPTRSPQEPDIERVVRGPRDGFVETIIFNAELIRRRVRDRSLIMEYLQVGARSKTDIVLCYIDNIADPKTVKLIKDRINAITVDGLAMGEKTLEEYIFGHHLNPYPLVRYTERADTSAVHLTEGHILIIVDGSPSVMICPSTFWHHLQHAEEYRQKPIVGIFLRLIRFLAVGASLFSIPVWYILASNPALLPESLKFIGVKEASKVPLIWQLLIGEIGLEVLRMAAIHTPNALATALGLVAAILIGQIAIDVGLFTPEVILYLAIAAISTFATPSYEFSLANRIFRIIFLIGGALFGIYGLLATIAIWLLIIIFTKSLTTPYFWPLIPFNGKALLNVFFRIPIPLKKERPSILHPKDNTRK